MEGGREGAGGREEYFLPIHQANPESLGSRVWGLGLGVYLLPVCQKSYPYGIYLYLSIYLSVCIYVYMSI